MNINELTKEYRIANTYMLLSKNKVKDLEKQLDEEYKKCEEWIGHVNCLKEQLRNESDKIDYDKLREGMISAVQNDCSLLTWEDFIIKGLEQTENSALLYYAEKLDIDFNSYLKEQ